MSDQDSGKSKLGRILIGAILVVVGITIYVVSSQGPGGDNGGPVDPTIEKNLGLTRTALALTENIEPQEAESVWRELSEAYPKDSSIALNAALNQVLLVDSLAGKATNPLLSAEEKRAARQKLPDAISLARASVKNYEQVSTDAIKGLWLKSRVDLQEAGLLPAAMTKTIRREIFDRLSHFLSGPLGKAPESVILGGPLTEVLDQLQDPIDGLPADLLTKATKQVGALSDQHNDNLFLALRAARLHIEAKDPEAEQFVTRSAELASAISPLLDETTKPIGLTANELAGKITAAIKAEQWNDANNRMLQWFNILNPTEIMKTDRRRTSPHPLDRLSFDSLRRLSAEAIRAEPLNKGSVTIAFQSSPIEQSSGVQQIQAIDFDLDLVSDIAAISGDTIQLWANDGDSWTDAGKVELDIQPSGLCVADLFMVDSSDQKRIRFEAEVGDSAEQDYSTAARHDTFPGLIAYGDGGVRLVAIDGRKSTSSDERLKTVEKESGLEDLKGVQTIRTGDLEGDGDLDLVIATKEQGIRLFINRGNRTFFEATTQNDFAKDDIAVDIALADIDRDLDLDIVTLHQSGGVGMLENLLHLQFRGRLIDEISKTADASSIAVADVDGNVSWDLVIGSDQGTTLVFSQTADAGMWTVERVETSQAAMPNSVIADLDNDSWSELVTADSGGGEYLRLGPWGIDSTVEIDSIKASSVPLQIADFNADGKLDLAAVNDGTIKVWINQTQNDNHYLTVRFRGIADNAANSGRVNHFGIGSVLELRFGPHYRSQIITSPATHFGLDGYDTAGSIRVVFPNGITQTIREPAVDSIVEEQQSLKGSCPYLYAWDGEKYVFMTDCLWAAPLGLQVARGVVAKDRPWEYLKIDGQQVRPLDDRYHLRITEELWEIAYIEKVGLSTIDHPADVQIWTNEKVGPAHIAEQTVFAFRNSELRDLASAVDTNGRDIAKELKNRDGNFVQGFDRRIRQGLCPPHWIDLDFGKLTFKDEDKPSIYLVLTGWILPTDTSLNIQIDQNPELLAVEFPSVWVPDADESEGWRKAIPFMGFPGGKTKTIVVDVTDVVDRNDARLRIRTSAQIYWDDAKLAVQTEPAPFVQQSTDLLSAQLTYHGYSARRKDDARSPEVYDYQSATQTPRWPPLRGRLTQFGECDALIADWDDQMVVMGAGDELQMTFSVPGDRVPEGWKRDFVLHCVGWDKDADLNTLTGQSTGPLPHRQMSQYPPTAGDWTESEATERKNQRHLQRQQSFRAFWYRDEESQPTRFLPANPSGF